MAAPATPRTTCWPAIRPANPLGFWADWQIILDLAPKGKFIDVILRHELLEASIAIRDVDYREVLDPSHASPYYCTFIGMATAFSGRYRHSGSDEIVHFTFDTQEQLDK